jgi:hypothetical protein
LATDQIEPRLLLVAQRVQKSSSAPRTRLWAKREEQIHGVVETMAGLYGDLQGIGGRSLQEIQGLEVPLLDGPAASEAAE